MFERIFQSTIKKKTISAWFLRSAILFLGIEFFDELSYGVQGASLPALRADLGLDYAQVGALLGLAGFIGGLVEPLILLFGDTLWRKRLMVVGGGIVALSLMGVAASNSFLTVLLAFIFMYPASGAFVTLGQASLMDQSPGRQSQMMARWSVAGSIGNLVGPLLLAGSFAIGLGWRWAYLALAVLAIILVFLVVFNRIHPNTKPTQTSGDEEIQSSAVFSNLCQAIRNKKLIRWLMLLEISDLLLDVYTSYLALYLADIVGLSDAQVALVLGGLMGMSLLSDVLLIPLLEKLPGLKLIRVSAFAACLVYPALLLVPWVGIKIALALIVRLTTIGWYPVLSGESFASFPERSATVTAVNSMLSSFGKILVWLVGWIALKAGLQTAMWILFAAPIMILIFVKPASLKQTHEDETL